MDEGVKGPQQQLREDPAHSEREQGVGGRAELLRRHELIMKLAGNLNLHQNVPCIFYALLYFFISFLVYHHGSRVP